jgi:hypothetical protein
VAEDTGSAKPEPAEAAADVGESGTDAPTPEDKTSPLATLFGLLIMAGGIALLVWIVAELAPGDIHEKKDPGFLDNVFANGVVIAAARIVLISAAAVLLFGGLYIVISVLVRMRRGHWLRRAGPFESEIAEDVAKGLDQADDVIQWWSDALEENEELERKLVERDEAIESLLEERQYLIEELEKRAGT